MNSSNDQEIFASLLVSRSVLLRTNAIAKASNDRGARTPHPMHPDINFSYKVAYSSGLTSGSTVGDRHVEPIAALLAPQSVGRVPIKPRQRASYSRPNHFGVAAANIRSNQDWQVPERGPLRFLDRLPYRGAGCALPSAETRRTASSMRIVAQVESLTLARACKSWGGSQGGPLVLPVAASVSSGVG